MIVSCSLVAVVALLSACLVRALWQRRALPARAPFAPGALTGGRAVDARAARAEREAAERAELLAREREALHQLEAAHERLRVSEERFRLTFDDAPIGMALVALDGRFERVNGVFCEIVGYGAQELARLRFQDITHPEDLDIDLALARALLAGELPRYQLEKRYVRRDGHIVTVMLNVSLLRRAGGAPICYIAQVEDITARKYAEAALRSSEARFRGLVAASAQIVWTTDALGAVVEESPSWRAFTGQPFERARGAGWLEALHPDDREAVSASWRTAIEARAPLAVECRLRQVDGSWRWTSMHGVPLFGPDGGVREWVAMNSDIEARKQAEKAVKASEARSSGILAVSADALISIDEAQRIVMFNEGASKIFGYTQAEALGLPLEALIPERLRAVHRQHVSGFAVGRTVARRMGDRGGAAITGVRKSGEEFPADAAISRLTIGGMRLLTVAVRDVTEQRRLEAELRKAVRARDDVLSIVAHDLRNPLSTILMQVTSMARPEPEPERRNQRPVQSITRAARRMNRLIQDLLDVAQVDAARLIVERQPLRARELLVEATDVQRELAQAASLSLEVDVAQVQAEVLGDRDRLLQVFENLIGNAIKFTLPGGTIRVGAVETEREVQFRVADDGAGIASESLGHVFDRFWQAAENRGRMGAGLGLAISKGIVEAHGGRIWAESVLGKGSTFYFAIPRSLTS